MVEVLHYINSLPALFLTVLAEQDSAAAQQYVRQGCPTALRADLWALILNISNQPEVSGKGRVKCGDQVRTQKCRHISSSDIFSKIEMLY